MFHSKVTLVSIVIISFLHLVSANPLPAAAAPKTLPGSTATATIPTLNIPPTASPNVKLAVQNVWPALHVKVNSNSSPKINILQKDHHLEKRADSLEEACGVDYVNCGSGYCCQAGNVCFLQGMIHKCTAATPSSSQYINALISSYNSILGSYSTLYSGVSLPTLPPYNSLDSANYENYISSYIAILSSLSITDDSYTNYQYPTFTSTLPSVTGAGSIHDATSNTTKSNSHTGTIVGGIVGGLIIIAIIAGITVCCCLRKGSSRRRKTNNLLNNSGGNPNTAPVVPSGFHGVVPGFINSGYSQINNPVYTGTNTQYHGAGGVGSGGQDGFLPAHAIDGKQYYDPGQNYQVYGQQQQNQTLHAGGRPDPRLTFSSELGGQPIGGPQTSATYSAELDGGVPYQRH